MYTKIICYIILQGDDAFPAPPPASDMLNMEFAPERSTAEVPIAPKSFEPIHIAVSGAQSLVVIIEVDTIEL